MTNWEKILNKEQCEAVTAGDGPILVLAAAGTGKTQTLTHRVAYLIEQGVNPYQILLLTFTNRAAKEMILRAQGLVDIELSTMWSGTFHHICHRILRSYAREIGLTPRFLILDHEESLSLINKSIRTHVSDPKNFPKKDVISSMISLATNKQCDLREVVEQRIFKEPVDTDLILQVADGYIAAKREANAIDFDDLLVLALQLLKSNPEILEIYKKQFKYVLVDEYQDTNTLQSELVDLLASGSRNIMAVGDDFQCVYSWRGADFRNIMEFPKRWPDCKIIKLEQNYRSSPEVLAIANACIAGNPEQFQKQLRSILPSGSKPVVAYVRDASEQSQMVYREIQRARADGARLEDIVVLYRSHFHSVELQMDLRRMHVDYMITSGPGLFDSAHVKDVVAFLRMCHGGTDQFAFARMMELLPGVGAKTCEGLWAKLEGKFESSSEADRARLKAILPKKARADWETIDALMAQYHREGWEINGNRATSSFLDRWFEGYLQRTYDNAEDRAQDISALAAQFSKGASVGEFLYEVALMTNMEAEGMQSSEGKILLSTIHQAKGLEWPVVIIIWCDEDMFPSAKSLAEGDDTEERRLFYVAVTRAKRTLLMCVPSMRKVMGTGGVLYLRPSRFVRELPPEMISKHYGAF